MIFVEYFVLNCCEIFSYRSGDEPLEASVRHSRQSADVKSSERSNDTVDAGLPPGSSTTQQVGGISRDLVQQLQRAVRDEMRHIMEVHCCRLTTPSTVFFHFLFNESIAHTQHRNQDFCRQFPCQQCQRYIAVISICIFHTPY